MYKSGYHDLYGYYNLGREQEWPPGSGQWRVPPPPNPSKVKAFIAACAEVMLDLEANRIPDGPSPFTPPPR